jgi:hypothetical protein
MPHLKKTVKSARLAILVAATLVGVVAGSAYFANQLTNRNAEKACSPSGHTIHSVLIRNGVATPYGTTAKRCDNLTITNLDDTNRLIAFGRHDAHTPYDGIEERLLGKGQTLKVVLIENGNFRFHDHLDDAVQGTFSVRNGGAN